MLPMDPRTTGSISTGFTSYSGRFCMPPYSQNADAAHSYIIVHANNVSDSEIAGEEKGVAAICLFSDCLFAILSTAV